MLGGSGLPPLDLQAVLRYGITALALIFGLLVLVRNAASRYFVVDGGFGGESGGYDARGPEMPGGEEKCFVCGRRGIKKCARCKSVRYCSQECQAKHWKYGHKLKCKEPKLSNDFVESTSICTDRNDERVKVLEKRVARFDDFVESTSTCTDRNDERVKDLEKRVARLENESRDLKCLIKKIKMVVQSLPKAFSFLNIEDVDGGDGSDGDSQVDMSVHLE